MEYEKKIQEVFNAFNGKNLELLNSFYSDGIDFQDSVAKVKGLNSLKKYYSKAFSSVKSIRFDFTNFIQKDKKVSATWKMHLEVFGLNLGRPFTVEGCSVFEFNETGLVVFQRDYFDVGEMVYERIPVQGQIVKLIRRFLSHGFQA